MDRWTYEGKFKCPLLEWQHKIYEPIKLNLYILLIVVTQIHYGRLYLMLADDYVSVIFGTTPRDYMVYIHVYIYDIYKAGCFQYIQ